MPLQGHENWFVMINAPGDYGQDWDQINAESRKNHSQENKKDTQNRYSTAYQNGIYLNTTRNREKHQ